MNIDDQNTEITAKLKALGFTLNKTDGVIAKENEEVSERQKTSITTMIKVVNNLKESIEEQMFAKGQSDDQVRAWGEEVENRLAVADDKVVELTAHIQRMKADRREAEDAHEKLERLKFQQLKFEQQQAHDKDERKQQLDFERQLLDQKLDYQKRLEEAHPDPPKRALPLSFPNS